MYLVPRNSQPKSNDPLKSRPQSETDSVSSLIDSARPIVARKVTASRNLNAVIQGSQSRISGRQCVDLFPANLLSDDALDGHAAGSHAQSWWLAHARPRQEKAIASELLALGIAYYLPLVPRKSITRGRTRSVQIPLFPGYIFVCGAEHDRLRALKTNRIVSIVSVPDGECLRRQLSVFARLIAAGAPLVREARLVPGERVRIKTGPFRDAEGVILRRQGKTELLVGIDFLGQGASLRIEDCGTEAV